MIKKIFFSFIIFTFVAAIIAYFFGSRIISKSIKAGVESFGPKITQTPVHLNEVQLSILSGNGKLTGLYVGNPEGFSGENIFALGQIDVDINSRSILSDQIVINKIHIRKPQIDYEKTLRSSNLKELLKNIESASDSEAVTDTQEPQTDDTSIDKSTKDVLIKELIVEEATASVSILGIRTTVQLPRIELNDLSGSGEQIAAKVLDQIVTKIFEEIQSVTAKSANTTGKALDSITNPYEEPIKQINDKINNLIGR